MRNPSSVSSSDWAETLGAVVVLAGYGFLLVMAAPVILLAELCWAGKIIAKHFHSPYNSDQQRMLAYLRTDGYYEASFNEQNELPPDFQTARLDMIQRACALGLSEDDIERALELGRHEHQRDSFTGPVFDLFGWRA